MMNIKEAIKTINSNPYSCKEALENEYHEKLFIVVDSYSNRIDRFSKTKRGAEGYIKRQQNVSYYDDYSQDMVICGSGLEVLEIPANEILDPTSDISVWYNYLKDCYWRDWEVNNTLKMAKQFNVNTEVMEFVESKCNELLTESGFTIIDEYEEIETQPETIENEVTETEITITASESHNEPTGVTYQLNEEKNGVEIYFTDKPSEDVRNMMKASGFRWSKYNKCWYAKQSDKTLAIAKQLVGEQIENRSY